MPLSYDDLIEPAIVKQVSKNVAYCRCTRTKNPPFCDGSHEGTNVQPHILEFAEPTTIAICRCWRSKTTLLRRHPRPLGEAERKIRRHHG
jgi:CDGSH-type Zn-finger protein